MGPFRAHVALLLVVIPLAASSSAGAQTAPDSAPPAPAETNWASLLEHTGRDFAAFPRRPSTWIFLAAGGALALAAHPADDYVERQIVGSTSADRIFVAGKVIGNGAFQAGAALTLYVVGRHLTKDAARTHPLTHLGFDMMRTQIVTQSIVHGIKYSVQRDRPTGECCAFPSGHAASAFAAASVIERHFGLRRAWPALLGASYVAASRLVDNRHFLSDVVFGAAVGQAAGWTVVGRHRPAKFTLVPVPVRGGMMVALVPSY